MQTYSGGPNYKINNSTYMDEYASDGESLTKANRKSKMMGGESYNTKSLNTRASDNILGGTSGSNPYGLDLTKEMSGGGKRKGKNSKADYPKAKTKKSSYEEDNEEEGHLKYNGRNNRSNDS